MNFEYCLGDPFFGEWLTSFCFLGLELSGSSDEFPGLPQDDEHQKEGNVDPTDETGRNDDSNESADSKENDDSNESGDSNENDDSNNSNDDEDGEKDEDGEDGE